MDDFDTQINSEEIQDHDPDETCSTCGERVINCTCYENSVCSQCGSDDWGCQCGQPDLQQEYEDLYGGENDYGYDPHMDWW